MRNITRTPHLGIAFPLLLAAIVGLGFCDAPRGDDLAYQVVGTTETSRSSRGSEAPPAYSSVDAPDRDAPRVHGLLVESGFYLRSTGAVAVDS